MEDELLTADREFPKHLNQANFVPNMEFEKNTHDEECSTKRDSAIVRRVREYESQRGADSGWGGLLRCHGDGQTRDNLGISRRRRQWRRDSAARN